MWFVNFDMITINRFQIQSMEVKPKTDVLKTTDALGCVLVHKKGEIVRNFLFPFIKRRLKDDIIRVLFEGDMTRKEYYIDQGIFETEEEAKEHLRKYNEWYHSDDENNEESND